LKENNQPPRFSVIIPVYNRSDLVIGTINTVLNQTVQPFEIVICNDGSTDNTADIISSINCPLIKLINIENSGPSYARKIAVEHAKGDWLAFLDSDDQWHPNYLETISTIASTSNAECIIANFKTIQNKKTLKESKFSEAPSDFFKTDNIDSRDFEEASDDIFIKTLNFQPCFPSALSCTIDAYKKVGGITLHSRTLKSEDSHLTRKLYFYSKVYFLFTPLVEIHIHENNRSNNLSGETDYIGKLKGRLSILKILLKDPLIIRQYNTQLTNEIEKSEVDIFRQIFWAGKYREALKQFSRCDSQYLTTKDFLYFIKSKIVVLFNKTT